MTILVIASQKGGVGKTTVAINLSYSLAVRGYKVLLVDTDPQGSVGLSLSRGARERHGFYDAIAGVKTVEELIIPTRLAEFNLMTSGKYEMFLDESDGSDMQCYDRINIFFNHLRCLDNDLVIVDTSAGIGTVTTNILKEGDSVIIPQQSEPLGVRSIPQFLKKIVGIRRKGSEVSVSGILMTMVNPHQRESVESESQLRSALPSGIMFQTSIPRDSVFLRASSLGVPVGLLSRNPVSAAVAFDQLAAELELKLGLSNNIEKDHGVKGLLD
ncbi:MAG: AAA family ATPase [Verrucomicrobiota bacterium]|nr:AAA family ATPase [Verrucomicrobiota bacterium]